MVKLVRAQSKGMVTIPVDFRKNLGIESDTLLEAHLTDQGVLFVKVDVAPQAEIYSDEAIQQWLKNDRMDKKIAAKLKKLLK